MVEVTGGTVLVVLLVSELPPALDVVFVSVLSPSPVCPAPAGWVVSALELESAAPLDVLELESELAVELDVEELPAALPVLLLLVLPPVAGVAVLVVGTVSGGAPVVSFRPVPLPPQAASTSPARIAASTAITAW